jgi:tRNA(Ile)-lysidine synthase
VNARAQNFSSEWLDKRLSELIPGYPAVSFCVALSGGVDSTALLAALTLIKGVKGVQIKEVMEERKSQKSSLGKKEKKTSKQKSLGLSVRAVHIHHGLHANAAEWSAHCRRLAKRLHVPLKVLKARVDRSPGTSLEAEARKARYAILGKELHPGEILLTAHHEDDQLETVLLQLFRGAGLAGLAAMPELAPFAQGLLARPILPLPRASLETFAHAHRLTWIEDDTNLDPRFDRNYLRQSIIPLIKARWPGAGRAAARSARHIAEAQKLLNALALTDLECASVGAALSVKVLRRLPPERRRNALRYWIARRGATLPNTRRLEELAGPVLAARPEAHPKVEWEKTSVQRRADLLYLQNF